MDLSCPLLCVRKLSICYGRRPVVTDVTFGVTERQIVAVVGPNGAGKTTILKAIAGLIRPIHGEIIFKGEHTESLSVQDMVRRGVVYVPEGMNVFPHMSVEENLEVGAYLHRRGLRERLKTVYEIFPELYSKRNRPAGALSGGEQRMLTVGRGLMARVTLLLLDDPFLGLSPRITHRLCDALHEMKRQGITLLIAGQHIKRLLTAADWGFLIEDGHITLSGSGSDLLQNDHLRQVLFGRVPLETIGIAGVYD
ncbi:ABC transporter ATP-binding protein [Thermodesulforhabdus norvegica]|uniref:Branched-chain amino acid transport system ATP-binding protein n=1 Tax=Thermodesulforhabdus norvegica TaxID=39841 RepID=A0A1I4UR16_9BACT|nr:ABC transporter ATP-binding protein [Thermodesulforhabdus norvegica]SFM91190.1 branched-chain amino acid transport system ATP-binding protein [Thermodesulforhabdus norvegica]